ncbi:MAG: methyltransferase domain-containing protein [Blastocatellia bacterium]|nr:methyltransferase domain-containing protein [Blastocatellia bacterium]
MTNFIEELEALLLERAFDKGIKERHQLGKLTEKELMPVAKALSKLSRSFTGREEFQSGYLKDDSFRQAYLLYYLPSNILKSTSLMKELNRHPSRLLEKQQLTVLDLGSGPGTATLGLVMFLLKFPVTKKIKFVAVDMSEKSLQDCKWLVEKLSSYSNIEVEVEVIKLDLEKQIDRLSRLIYGKEFDLIVAANLINELFKQSRDPITERRKWLSMHILPLLEKDGSLFLIEPALKSTTQALMDLRDKLLSEDKMSIYSPCPSSLPCPMLKTSEKDWCHSVTDWKRPSIVAQLDRIVGNRKEMLKFSYLILRRDGKNLSDIIAKKHISSWRLVSEKHNEKGKSLIYGCNGEDYYPIVRLKREISPQNLSFNDLERGQLAVFEAEKKKLSKTEIKIEAETVVEIYGPFL